MVILTEIQEILSGYVVSALLLIGLYMRFWQSKVLSGTDGLEREARFVKYAGYVYIGIGVLAGILLMIG